MSWDRIQEFLGTEIISIGDVSIDVGTALVAVSIALLTILLSHVLERGAIRLLRLGRINDEGTLGVSGRVVHYLVLVVGFGVAIDTLGINLRTLFAAGAVLAVAVGFAAQNVLQNFFSGLILLSEGAIKPGDVLEVEGSVVRVSRMGIRSTVVRTRDEEELILPNNLLSQAAVKNYTLKDSIYRLRTQVGVHYRSDMKQVRRVLEETAAKLAFRRQGKEPVVLMTEFGNSAVIFDVSIWIDDPWEMLVLRSRLNEAVWWALKDAGITIAFPQVDVHLDDSAVEALRS